MFVLQGLVAATGVCVGVMNVSALVDGKILDCPEFCTPTSLMQGAGRANNVSPTRSQNCYGRYVQFGAQVRFPQYMWGCKLADGVHAFSVTYICV